MMSMILMTAAAIVCLPATDSGLPNALAPALSARQLCWRLRGGGSGSCLEERKEKGSKVDLSLHEILGDVDSDEVSGDRKEAQPIDFEYECKRLRVEVEALRMELRARSGEAGDADRSQGAALSSGVQGDGKADSVDEIGSAGERLIAAQAMSAQDMGLQERIKSMAKHIPVRLTLAERKMLRLLEAALSVSEYVDKIDVHTFKSRTARMVAMVREICALLCGLLVASDYKQGQETIQDKNYADNQALFRAIFEVGRRHKIMNPDKMREGYGKLIYMLQDVQSREVSAALGFKAVSPLKTVAGELEAAGVIALLDDPLVALATAEIDSLGRERSAIARDIRNKEAAIEHLAKAYAGGNGGLSQDGVRQCLYSIGDANAFLRVTRQPCEDMLEWLRQEFDPAEAEEGYSLAIRGGQMKARLTHSHARQYRYVEQSLMLWSEVLANFFKLWALAEADLTDESSHNRYSLRETGQGMQRVQPAGRVGREMHRILAAVQSRIGGRWEGSSVIHLGDHNVPNALMFIDKYAQIERILNPIVLCLRRLPGLYAADKGVAAYFDAVFGGVHPLRKRILHDFFRGAFDGSGADNFFDAGSCIDGRLTSAWNWCSQIEAKPFFPAMLLTGFTGFDGKFE